MCIWRRSCAVSCDTCGKIACKCLFFAFFCSLRLAFDPISFDAGRDAMQAANEQFTWECFLVVPQ